VLVDCVKDPHDPSANYSYPVPAPGAVGRGLNTARASIRDHTLIVPPEFISATSDTVPKLKCGHCEGMRGQTS